MNNILHRQRSSLSQGSIKTTQFTYNGTYYQQVFGTAMGSPVSAVIANMVMEDVLRCVIRIRYVLGAKKLFILPSPVTVCWLANWLQVTPPTQVQRGSFAEVFTRTTASSSDASSRQSFQQICTCWLYYSGQHRRTGRYKIWCWCYLQRDLGKNVTKKKHLKRKLIRQLII